MQQMKKAWITGEPFVWLTSMGLAVGLLMVILLLMVIAFNGFRVFWPHRVLQLTLREDSSAGIRGSSTLGGELVKKQQKHAPRILKEDQKQPTEEELTEWQIFTGNREIYGFSFKYVDYLEIEQVEYPRDILVIERLEYGDAIGIPLHLEIQGEELIPAGDTAFNKRLAQLKNEVVDRWKEIRRIERKDIGRINARMESLRLERRSLETRDASSTSVQARLQSIDDEVKDLQERYEVLAQQARSLRSQQEMDALHYRLLDGQETRMKLGQLVSFYYPNKIGFFQRTGIFLRNLWVFVRAEPREANTEGGIFPAIFGTFVMTLLMSIAVMPFGVLAAIYLREYARQGLFVRCVRIAVNNLAGVPSIVFGVFGLGFFVYLTGGTIDSLFFSTRLPTPTFGTGGIFWASLTLALMTVPVVIVSTEEGLAAVPRGMREASLALGGSKWQTVQRVVLPASSPGMLTGLILAMARGAGEVAPLMLVGVVKMAPSLPLDSTFPYIHLERKFMHLGFHIYDLGFQSPDAEAAKPMVFATTLLLIGLVVILNLSAIIIREKLRKKYGKRAF